MQNVFFGLGRVCIKKNRSSIETGIIFVLHKFLISQIIVTTSDYRDMKIMNHGLQTFSEIFPGHYIPMQQCQLRRAGSLINERGP